MKRLVAIALITGLLSSITELHQLLKLPVLLEHYAEHCGKDQKLTFWEFMRMHYANDEVKDADYQRDMQLPFKSHSECVSILLSFSVVPEKQEVISPAGSVPVCFSKHEELLISTAYHSSVWQPPKSV